MLHTATDRFFTQSPLGSIPKRGRGHFSERIICLCEQGPCQPLEILLKAGTLMSSMARRARIVIPGEAHHVVQRGNNGNSVFFTPSHRAHLLGILSELKDEYGVSFLSYCLMDNHVHFIAVPHSEESLAGLFRCAFMKYSSNINKTLGRSGHLWQSRYFSSPMDAPYLYNSVRYIERNPVRAGIVDRPWEYRWSSAAFHLDLRQFDPLVEKSPDLDEYVEDWELYLSQTTAAEELDRIRRATSASKPVGSRGFLDRLAERYGDQIYLRRKGRPPSKARERSSLYMI